MPSDVTLPDYATHGPLAVALVYDGLATFEFGITAEIFGLARPEMGEAWYRFASCAVDAGPMRAHGGLAVTADHGLDLLGQADIIVVPGWKSAEAPVPEDLCVRLRAAHARGARLVSICSGAFVLAATGLLDGAEITTHWRYAQALAARFPRLQVDAARLYCGHDGVFTSAGSAAGIDLLIDIVRQDFGAGAANSVARRMVVPAHRTRGQAQFLERPVPLCPEGEIAPVLDQIRATLETAWTTDEMARIARMSLRTFLRRFQEATGTPPGDWLQAERVEAAKTLLQGPAMSVERIAAQVGFGSAHTLRHHFRRRIGVTPTEYRARFLSA